MAKIISGEFERTRCYTEEEYGILKAEKEKGSRKPIILLTLLSLWLDS